MVHASTPATALVAYGARVELAGVGGKTRTLAVSDLLLPPQICDVAVVLRMDRETVRSASIVLGWVAPTPRHAVDARPWRA